jgi:hypothetical protein
VNANLTTTGVVVATATFASSFNLLATDLLMVIATASISATGGTNSASFKGGFTYSGGTSFVDSSFSQGANSASTGFLGQNVPYLYAGTGLALSGVTNFSLQMNEANNTYPVNVNQVRLIAAILRAG